jgi:hypothetical protein
MSGSSNILQWNPTGANQETDTAYTSDALRTGGATDPSIFPSLTANKVLYQVTTFIAALAQALAAKGLVISDASLSTLAGVLANVLTASDLTTALALYAPISSPVFTGTPQAPTPTTGDNSASLATTAFVKGQGYINSVTAAMVLSALGFTPVQQGGGAGQGSNKIFLGWDGRLRLQVDSSDQGDLAFFSDLSAYTPASNFTPNSVAASGYLPLPGGLILQWGVGSVAASSSGSVFAFPKTWPNACFALISNDNGGGATPPGVHVTTCEVNSTSQFTAYAKDSTGAFAFTGLSWFAIGH